MRTIEWGCLAPFGLSRRAAKGAEPAAAVLLVPVLPWFGTRFDLTLGQSARRWWLFVVRLELAREVPGWLARLRWGWT